MKKLNLKKGFTLIELLVVVAIIGILASVVLASLNSARAKGSDAAVKSNLDNMRAQAAIYYDTNGKYNTTSGTAVTCNITSGGTQSPSPCTALFADPTFLSGLTQAASTSGNTVYGATDTTGALYAVAATLKSVTTNAWCVDSGGKSELVTSGAATAAMVVSASCP